MSEGLRAALTPSLGHMGDAYILLGLTVFLVLLTRQGMKGFARRVLS
jgi:ABC-2 type transport system permease protein